MPELGLSSHPVDVLIRELIETRRSAESAEIARILDHIATAEFDTRMVRTRTTERNLTYESRQLMPWEDALFVHLVRRVVRDAQWVAGTTAEEYVADLRRTTRVDPVGLALYFRRGGSLAAVLAPTDLVVPAERRGARSPSELAVIYSADRSIIVTGYQFRSRAELAIPEDAQWLL
jgi:hypothetical protein